MASNLNNKIKNSNKSHDFLEKETSTFSQNNSLKNVDVLDNFLGEEKAGTFTVTNVPTPTINASATLDVSSIQTAFNDVVDDVNTELGKLYANDGLIKNDLTTLHTTLGNLITNLTNAFNCTFAAPDNTALTFFPAD